jgi:hypothetical protein
MCRDGGPAGRVDSHLEPGNAMGKKDPRVDAYIANAAPFAQPILERLRAVVHAACPDCEEAIKWGTPHFLYKGLLAGMAAFRKHATFGFWKGSLVVGADGDGAAMGQFGRLTKVGDLPPKARLTSYVKKAMRLNDEAVPAPHVAARRSAPKPAVATPADLVAALERNRKAGATYAKFTPGKRREYVEWIAGAKTAATRQRRLAQAVEWMAEGKTRNWKYEKC